MPPFPPPSPIQDGAASGQKNRISHNVAENWIQELVRDFAQRCLRSFVRGPRLDHSAAWYREEINSHIESDYALNRMGACYASGQVNRPALQRPHDCCSFESLPNCTGIVASFLAHKGRPDPTVRDDTHHCSSPKEYQRSMMRGSVIVARLQRLSMSAIEEAGNS